MVCTCVPRHSEAQSQPQDTTTFDSRHESVATRDQRHRSLNETSPSQIFASWRQLKEQAHDASIKLFIVDDVW